MPRTDAMTESSFDAGDGQAKKRWLLVADAAVLTQLFPRLQYTNRWHKGLVFFLQINPLLSLPLLVCPLLPPSPMFQQLGVLLRVRGGHGRPAGVPVPVPGGAPKSLRRDP
jgi:hypothetical protein